MPEEPPVQQQGTSRSYILDRLKNAGLSDLAAAVEAGTVSAFAAAVECGWARRPPTVDGRTSNQARRRRHQFQAITDGGLSLNQVLQELWLGHSHNGSHFDSPDELRAAWMEHRDEVMRLFAGNGRRPQGWWAFESPIPWPGYHKQQSALYDAGLLGDEEKAELERRWRHEFERAYGPHFFYTEAPGEMLEGAAARRKHLDWADVPDSLRQRWRAERRRRGRTIKKLAEADEPVNAAG